MGRRGLLRLAAGAVVAASAAVGQLFGRTAGAGPPPDADTETYSGRRIRIRRVKPEHPGDHLPDDTVLIDGDALHVMSNADGTFTPVTHHYRTFRTLRAASRAAVDSLHGARLLPMHPRGHK
jgi:hypothetical protein